MARTDGPCALRRTRTRPAAHGILGRPPDPETARDVFERSDGNAFFAEELLATGAVSGGPLPASLHEVLSARLAALDDPTLRILRVAAVAGRVVGHELLERVAGVPSAALIASLREAVEQRVLVHVVDPVPGYAFRHALVREAAYDELLPTERESIHRTIADALERDAALSPASELARAGEIAYHAMAAHDVTWALVASLAAVAVAEEASAFAEAEVHLARILDIWRASPMPPLAPAWITLRSSRERPARQRPQDIRPERSCSRWTRWPNSSRATRNGGSPPSSSSSITRGGRGHRDGRSRRARGHADAA